MQSSKEVYFSEGTFVADYEYETFYQCALIFQQF